IVPPSPGEERIRRLHAISLRWTVARRTVVVPVLTDDVRTPGLHLLSCPQLEDLTGIEAVGGEYQPRSPRPLYFLNLRLQRVESLKKASGQQLQQHIACKTGKPFSWLRNEPARRLKICVDGDYSPGRRRSPLRDVTQTHGQHCSLCPRQVAASDECLIIALQEMKCLISDVIQAAPAASNPARGMKQVWARKRFPRSY